MFEWLLGKSIDRALTAPRMVRVKGVRFKIQKISVMNYVDGSKVLRETFETYKTEKNTEIIEKNWAKLKPYYIDVLMAGVVSPKLSRKPDEPETFYVEKMFNDMDMCNELINAIYEYTYGKKKLKKLVSQELRLLKSTP